MYLLFNNNIIMKFWLRKPSINKMIWARTSPKRFLAHNMWIKMPKNYWFIRDSKKFVYNKIYNKITFNICDVLKRIFK